MAVIRLSQLKTNFLLESLARPGLGYWAGEGRRRYSLKVYPNATPLNNGIPNHRVDRTKIICPSCTLDVMTTLFIWQDVPSIIIGRHQNPWAECNVFMARKLAVPIVRRYSGGGTVYHDLGNSVYSVIMPRSEFSRSKYANLIVDALKSNGCDDEVYRTERNDIWWGRRGKISGSAYKIIRDRAYHHGTILRDTDLMQLTSLLQSPLRFLSKPKIERQLEPPVPMSSAVTSFVSPTANLRRKDGSLITHQQWVRIVLAQFIDHHDAADLALNVFEDKMVDEAPIRQYYEELVSEEWIFGKTPPFIVDFGQSQWAAISNGIHIDQSNDANLLGKALADVYPDRN